MGARPLRRVIEEQIEDKVAEYYLNHPETGQIIATVEDEAIVIKKASEYRTTESSSDESNQSSDNNPQTEEE